MILRLRLFELMTEDLIQQRFFTFLFFAKLLLLCRVVLQCQPFVVQFSCFFVFSQMKLDPSLPYEFRPFRVWNKKEWRSLMKQMSKVLKGAKFGKGRLTILANLKARVYASQLCYHVRYKVGHQNLPKFRTLWYCKGGRIIFDRLMGVFLNNPVGTKFVFIESILGVLKKW